MRNPDYLDGGFRPGPDYTAALGRLNPFKVLAPHPRLYGGLSISLALLLATAALAATHDQLGKEIQDRMGSHASEPLRHALKDPNHRLPSPSDQTFHKELLIEVNTSQRPISVTKAFGRNIGTLPKGGMAFGVIIDTRWGKAFANCSDVVGLVLNDPNDAPADEEVCEFPRRNTRPVYPANASR